MNDYNFFSSYQKRKEINLNPGSPYFISSIILLIVVVLTAGIMMYNFYLNTQLDTIHAELMEVKASDEYTQAAFLKNSLQAMSEYDNNANLALQKFEASDIISSELLNQIFKGLPVNVKMVTFSVDQTTVSMSFDIPNRKAAAELLLGLKDTGLFQDLHLSDVSGEIGGILSTSVEGMLKAGAIQ